MLAVDSTTIPGGDKAMLHQHNLSRRQVLKRMGMSATGVALAACAPVGAPGEAAGESAAPAGEKKTVSISHIGGGSVEASEQSQRMIMLRAAFPDIEIENRWVSYA